MFKIDEVLLALAAKGHASDADRLAMVWIDRPRQGCFVRAADIFKIEPKSLGEPGSLVTVIHPNGHSEVLPDTRQARQVKAATERAQRDAVEQVWRRIAQQLQATSGAGSA